MNDPVNHPNHYGGGENPYETIKKIAAKGANYLRGFCLGNAEKYIDRAGKKESESEVLDLKKSRWYLDFFIRYLEHGMTVDPVGASAGVPGKSRVWYRTTEKLPADGEVVIGYYPSTSPVGDALTPIGDALAHGSCLVLKRTLAGWGHGLKDPTYWIRLPED